MGSLDGGLENVITLLSNSATWQAWVGAGDASAALAFIHKVAVPASSLNRSKPYAVVFPNDAAADAVGGGTGVVFEHRGSATVTLVAPIAAEDVADDGAAFQAFWVKFDLIWDELLALAGTDGFLATDSQTMGDGPQRGSDDEVPAKGHYLWVGIVLSWGP